MPRKNGFLKLRSERLLFGFFGFGSLQMKLPPMQTIEKWEIWQSSLLYQSTAHAGGFILRVALTLDAKTMPPGQFDILTFFALLQVWPKILGWSFIYGMIWWEKNFFIWLLTQTDWMICHDIFSCVFIMQIRILLFFKILSCLLFKFLRHLSCLCQHQLMRKYSNDGGKRYMTQLWFIQEH